VGRSVAAFSRQGQAAEMQERCGEFIVQFGSRFEFSLGAARVFLIDIGEPEANVG
jgi:hypothetical protein